jgi:hypothetical protein
MSPAKILKWVTGGLEALLGVPILGATIVISMLWTPLAVMFVLHIITLILTKKEGGSGAGSIIGIITSCLAWIPFVGMIMHIITAFILLIQAAKSDYAYARK